MTDWEIKPHRSVGPILFGMSILEVRNVLGDAEFTDAGVDPSDLETLEGTSFVEFRVFEGGDETHTPAVEYKEGFAVSLEFFPHHLSLQYDGVFLYKNAPRVTATMLMEKSELYLYSDDEYIFLDLGISMGIPEEDDEHIINIFAKGEYDDLVEENRESGLLKLVRK